MYNDNYIRPKAHRKAMSEVKTRICPHGVKGVSRCKQCRRKYALRYYHNNPEVEKKAGAARQREYRRVWAEEIEKRGLNKCSKCGYDKCANAIDFHHPDPTMKMYEGFSAFRSQKPTPERVAHLEHIIALCANCHRELHSKKIKI